jgi:hypothetical protein
MMLPEHVLEAFIDYFREEEEKQIQQLSRWYNRKTQNVTRKIDAILAVSDRRAPVDKDGVPLKHPTLRRPRPKSGARRLPTRRRTPSPSVSSLEGVEALDSLAIATGHTDASTPTDTPAPTTVRRKKKKPVPRPRKKSGGALDSDHPFHDDLSLSAECWANPLADPTATLRGATILSPSDVDLWIHHGLTEGGAHDLLLEQDYPGSWLIRSRVEGPREVVALMVDSGSGSPTAYPITRTPTGVLHLNGIPVKSAGTVRALMQVICSGESDTDAQSSLPALALDQAVLCEQVARIDFASGWSTDPSAGTLQEEVEDDTFEEEPALNTSASEWLDSLDRRYVHRTCSEAEAERMLRAFDTIGAWILRVVLPDEAWGDAAEAEIAVNHDGRGGEITSYRVSQCLDTGRLVVDGHAIDHDDTSLEALCDQLELVVGDAVRTDFMVADGGVEGGGGEQSLEWDPVHEGISLQSAKDAVYANQLTGSWLIRVPGVAAAGADLILYTGDGEPLCLPLVPTEQQTLMFDVSSATTRVPEGEYDSFDDLIQRLTTPTASEPAWLDLERAVPVWAVSQVQMAATSTEKDMPTTVLYDLLDGLLQGDVSHSDFNSTVSGFQKSTDKES